MTALTRLTGGKRSSLDRLPRHLDDRLCAARLAHRYAEFAEPLDMIGLSLSLGKSTG